MTLPQCLHLAGIRGITVVSSVEFTYICAHNYFENMKPKHYVSKYGLNKGVNFEHNEFVRDLTNDFIGQIEMAKIRNSDFNVKHFDQVVKEIRDKWDQIENKTLGQLPQKLWSYFYATVIVRAKESLFPEINQRYQEIDRMTEKELVEYLSDYDHVIWQSGVSGDYDIWRSARKALGDNPYLHYMLDRLQEFKDQRDRARQEQRERQEQKERQEYQEQWQRRQRNWSDFLFGLLFGQTKVAPLASFQILKLSTKATEDDVKQAYRTMALKFHPDKGGDADKFIEVTKAKNECLAYLNSK